MSYFCVVTAPHAPYQQPTDKIHPGWSEKVYTADMTDGSKATGAQGVISNYSNGTRATRIKSLSAGLEHPCCLAQ
jgi:hypothetical protein